MALTADQVIEQMNKMQKDYLESVKSIKLDFLKKVTQLRKEQEKKKLEEIDRNR